MSTDYPQPRHAETAPVRMSAGETLMHWTMIICTCGLYYPVYHHRKKHFEGRTRTTWA